MRSIVTLASIGMLVAACGGQPESSDIVSARKHVEDYTVSPVTFRSMDAFFPVAEFSASSKMRPLVQSTMDFSAFRFGDDAQNLDQMLEATDTNALLILHKGKLVYEVYRNGATSEDRFIGWSMSKSIIGQLIGVALEEGVIGSLQDPVEKYLPELATSAYGVVSIEQMLRMRAGTSYSEAALIGDSDLMVLAEQSLYTNERRFTDLSAVEITRTSPPGEEFNYSTLTTSILGRVLESATGQPINEYLEGKIWKPAGMQYSGYWLTDGPDGVGHVFGGGGVNATARDYARLGLLLAEGGEYQGQQIIPSDWIEQSCKHEGSEPVMKGTPRGYGLHFWTFVNTNICEAVGIHGQFISIDPDTETVIVKLSYWPDRGGGSYALLHMELFDALRQFVVQYHK